MSSLAAKSLTSPVCTLGFCAMSISVQAMTEAVTSMFAKRISSIAVYWTRRSWQNVHVSDPVHARSVFLISHCVYLLWLNSSIVIVLSLTRKYISPAGENGS